MPPREFHIDFEGHQIAVLAVNEHLAEPAIIFIPGVMAPVTFWNSCLPDKIRKHRRWYSISLPGHHPSTVPGNYATEDVNKDWFNRLYRCVISQLVGSEKVIVVGHSTGGFSALNLATEDLGQLLGVICIAGFYEGKWKGLEGCLVRLAHLGSWAKPLFVFNMWLGRLSQPVQRYLSGLLAFDRKAYSNSPVTDEMLDDIQAHMQNQKLGALFPLFNRIPTLNIEPYLERITAPVVIMAGSHDPVIPAEQSLKLAGAINHARLVVFKDAGHMPFMERTEQFHSELLQAILDFDDNSNKQEYAQKGCRHALS